MNYTRILIFAALGTGAVLGSLGTQDNHVSLASAREIWSDVLRDAEFIGLRATRMTVAEEAALGNHLAVSLQNWAAEDARDSQYVTAVAATLLPYAQRREMPYRFHVIESPAINAFALPGGHIYILRGMMDFLQNEAELAAILGHEISHVDLRHCVERYQYQHALKKVGAGSMGATLEMARALVTIGYSQFQELDADAQGARLATQAGYDPSAAGTVFARLDGRFGGAARPDPNRPLEELSRSMEEALSDYFSTHPRASDRARRMHNFATGSQFDGQQFFIGTQNYRQRIPMAQSAPQNEFRPF
jgi:beta-barrel assembly-enhancing protease